MGRDLFISHAEEDGELALALAEQLQKLQLSTWAYENDGVPGVSYLTQIDAAIEDCAVFLLLASAHSVNNHQVIREVEQAHERRRMIIAARLGMTHQQFAQSNAILRVACGTAVTLAAEAGNLSTVAERISTALSTSSVSKSRATSILTEESIEPKRQVTAAAEPRRSPTGAAQQPARDDRIMSAVLLERAEVQGPARKIWPGLWIGLLGETLWAATAFFDLIQYGRMEGFINANFGGTSPQLSFSRVFPLIGVASGIWLWSLLTKYIRTGDHALIGRQAMIALTLSTLSFLLTHGFLNYWIFPDTESFNLLFLPGMSTYFLILNFLFVALQWRGLQTLRLEVPAASISISS